MKYLLAVLWLGFVSALPAKGWVLIDTKGQALGTLAAEPTGLYSEGLWQIRWKDKIGYADNSARIIIPPTFANATEFRCGRALAATDQAYQLIDHNGAATWTCPLGIELEGIGGDGCTLELRVKKGPLSPEAQALFKEKALARDTSFFFDGTTGALLFHKAADKSGMADAWFTMEGGWMQRFQNGKYGYVNKKGWWVIKPTLDPPADYRDAFTGTNVQPFRDGLALFSADKKFGYINRWGKVAIPADYDDAQTFSQGLAWVSKQGVWSAIRKNGQPAFDATFQRVAPFNKNGLAVVVPVSKAKAAPWGVINNRGAWVLRPRFGGEQQTLSPTDPVVLTQGMKAGVKKFGLINSKGADVYKLADDSYVFGFQDGHAWVQP